MKELIATHPVYAMLALLAVLNALTQALEAPTAQDGRGYRTLYRFMHALCFNFQYAAKAKFADVIPPAQP